MSPETILSAKIRRALKLAGYWVIRTGVSAKRGPSGTQSGEPGMPDLLVIGHDWVGFGECKVPGGKLSDVQIAWHARAQDRGQNVAVWTCAAEAIRSCEQWSRKARAA